jgi:hypothetical protein
MRQWKGSIGGKGSGVNKVLACATGQVGGASQFGCLLVFVFVYVCVFVCVCVCVCVSGSTRS